MAASTDFERILVKDDRIGCVADKAKYAVFLRWTKYYKTNTSGNFKKHFSSCVQYCSTIT